MPDHTDFEGLVVNDKNFNRIKIKNRDYILLHAHATGSLNKKDIMCGLLNGDAEELISLYPSSRHKIDTLLAQLNNFRNELQQIYDIATACYESTGRDRKKFAEKWKGKPAYGFQAINGVTPDQQLENMGIHKLLKQISSDDKH